MEGEGICVFWLMGREVSNDYERDFFFVCDFFIFFPFGFGAKERFLCLGTPFFFVVGRQIRDL